MEKQVTRWLSMLLLLAILGACSTTKEVENEVQDELGDFRSWISTTTANVADRTEEDWQQARQDFQMRTWELDQKQENFSEEVRQDYQNLKDQFNEADNQYQGSNSDAQKAEWQHKLLGRWDNLVIINADNVQDAYITFMENVRSMHKSWTEQDWEMAKSVFNTLNERRKTIPSDISTETEVKIKALQIEFHALETAADATN